MLLSFPLLPFLFPCFCSVGPYAQILHRHSSSFPDLPPLHKSPIWKEPPYSVLTLAFAPLLPLHSFFPPSLSEQALLLPTEKAFVSSATLRVVAISVSPASALLLLSPFFPLVFLLLFYFLSSFYLGLLPSCTIV